MAVITVISEQLISASHISGSQSEGKKKKLCPIIIGSLGAKVLHLI